MSNQIQSKYPYLSELIQGQLCGELSNEQFKKLSQMLSDDPKCLQYYVEYTTVWALLDETSELHELDVDAPTEYVPGFLEALAEEERTAETVKIPEKNIQRELIQKVERNRIQYKLSTSSIISILTVAAAVIFLVLFIRLSPTPKGQQVAILSDSIHAKWADMNGTIKQGDPLVTSFESLLLREGYAELLFNTNAKVTIEAPAEFQILAEDAIKLNYGKIYATVPQEAIGFTVNTQTAKIIDLGTEFGIQADLGGATSLHVLKGKTTLIAGQRFNKTSVQVTKHYAKKVSSMTLDVSDIPCDDRLFVRHVNSDNEILWRGQSEFNLADVVGGGNGFGSGQLNEGISLSDGAMKSDYHGKGIKGTGDYHLVSGSQFVDGVFVPGVDFKPVQVSSKGHFFKECPSTSGLYTVLRNGGIAKELAGTVYPLELNGQIYGTSENPVLSLRSNSGITFDLDAVRSAMGCQVQAFRSLVGISSNAEQISKLDLKEVDGQMIDVYSHLEGNVANADIFILIDGQLRQTATVTHEPETIVNIDIKLTPHDRFLTLVSTQGDDEWTYDWVMFARPYLILGTAE